MTVTLKKETLEAQRERQIAECSSFACQDTETLEQKLRDVDAEEIAAAKADDETARQAARTRRAALRDEQQELRDRIEAKQLAIEETQRLIRQRDREAAIRDLAAHASTAADVAPDVEKAFAALTDSIKRFATELNGVYRAAQIADPENEAGWRAVCSPDRLFQDVQYHLRATLGMSNGSAIHARPATEQAKEAKAFAESIR